MGRLKSFLHDEIDSWEPTPDPYDALGPADRAFPPDYDTRESVFVLMCSDGKHLPRPVNAFTFRSDAERVLSLMDMGRQVHAIPENVQYTIVEVPHDPSL